MSLISNLSPFIPQATCLASQAVQQLPGFVGQAIDTFQMWAPKLGAAVASTAPFWLASVVSRGTTETGGASKVHRGALVPLDIGDTLARKDVERRRLVRVAGGVILAPREEIADSFSMKLVSATTDQNTYWPNETVNLAILVPGRPKAEVQVELMKKDGTPRDLGKHELDENGVLHLEVMKGDKEHLGLGEYTVSARTKDGDISAQAVFSVVEGTIGPLSFGHPWVELTDEKQRDLPPGYYMFSDKEPGKRFGSKLKVRNVVMDEGRPYSGHATIKTRCFLPGCGGCEIDSREVTIKDGILEEKNLNTSGHSGPFAIDVTTKKGTLRYKFEKSGHVEREMAVITSGVCREFHAGPSPYEGTIPVPNRLIFHREEESQRSDDAFLLESPIADKDGKARFIAQRMVEGAKVYVYPPNASGKFEEYELKGLPKVIQKGEAVEVPISGPYSGVVVAGYYEGRGTPATEATAGKRDEALRLADARSGHGTKQLAEGYALVFTRGGLKVEVTGPDVGAPLAAIELGIRTLHPDTGAPVPATGVLRIFDTRVDSPSPEGPVISALGESLRDGAKSLGGLRDTTGMREFDGPRMRGEHLFSLSAAAPPAPAATSLHIMRLTGAVRGAGAPPHSRRVAAFVGAASVSPAGLRDSAPPPEASEGEPLPREGVEKVIYSALVLVGLDGAKVRVPLGPQTARWRAVFTAVHGLDTANGQAQVDAKIAASAEAQLPAFLLAGAKIEGLVVVNNNTGGDVTLKVSGAGLEKPIEHKVSGPRGEVPISLSGGAAGALMLEVTGSDGAVIDRRQINVRDVGEYPVTTSKFAVSDGKTAIPVESGERAAVYRNAGHLLKGVMANMTTTMESWFPHAEAVSSNVAANALLLKAIGEGIIDDEGETDHLVNQVRTFVRDLQDRFFDTETGLVRPYPGMTETNTLWSAWVARNLQSAVTALEVTPLGITRLSETLQSAREMLNSINGSLAARNESVPELAGFDPKQGGRDVITILTSDGKVMQKLITDDSVIKWVTKEFYPRLKGQGEKDLLEALYKVTGIGRLLGAYSRIGDMPYLIQLAKALWLAGEKERAALFPGRSERSKFYDLFAAIARTAVRTQEPGMVQGPAVLGGVYSNPQAMVRFLELLVMMAESEKKGERKRAQIVKVEGGGKLGEFKMPLEGADPFVLEGTGANRDIVAPEYSVVMVEGKGTFKFADHMASADRPAFFNVGSERSKLAMGEKTKLAITLNPGEDPLEYEAFIVVPSTTAIDQTGDIQLDYTGRSLLGQKAGGSEKIQMMRVPFRGSRTMVLQIDGANKGTSPGVVLVRHMHDRKKVAAVQIGEIRVS